MDFREFLAWERASRDTIDFKRIYVDITGDLIAGLMLSQILFWYLPDRDGNSKLRVNRNGHHWIVRSRLDWWSEIRISKKQADRAIRLLREQNLIIVKYHRFKGLRTTHLRLNKATFLISLQQAIEENHAQ